MREITVLILLRREIENFSGFQMTRFSMSLLSPIDVKWIAGTIQPQI